VGSINSVNPVYKSLLVVLVSSNTPFVKKERNYGKRNGQTSSYLTKFKENNISIYISK